MVKDNVLTTVIITVQTTQTLINQILIVSISDEARDERVVEASAEVAQFM